MTAAEVFANDATTTVTSGGTTAPSSGTTETWTVASSASFHSASTGVSQFHVADSALPAEIIAVTNISGTTWTVTRGAESTAPVAHTAGFTIFQVVTAGFLGTLSTGGTGTVTSVTAADTSIVVSGTPTAAPTLATGTLDVIATQHPPAADWSNNSRKITGLANGAAAGEAVTYGQLGSAAFAATSAFDASGAAASALESAIAACLPTMTQASWTGSGTLAADVISTVTATSGVAAMILPTPVTGSLVVVERESASTQDVTVTGNIRGVSSTTITLSLPSESEMFFGCNASWWPIAGHKTLSSLQALFAQLASNLSDLPSPSAARANLSLAWKDPATVCQVGALPGNTYASGVLTATANGQLVIDGVTMFTGMSALVTSEAAPASNGLYTVTQPGSAGTPYILTRSAGMTTGAQVPGAMVMIEEGTNEAGSGWFCEGAGPVIIGTTAIYWTRVTVIISGATPQPANVTPEPGTTGFTSDAGHVHPTTGLVTTPSSLTPYALLAGGTASTSAVQQVASLGTSGQVLTSNGAGALPAFQSGGVVVIDANSAHITQTGTANTAGAVGDAADSGHGHASSLAIPGDFGFAAWTFDPGYCTTGAQATASIMMTRFPVRQATVLSNVNVHVVLAGATMATNGSFMGIYDSSGNRQAVTADQSTAWASTGIKTTAFITPYTAPAGNYYFAAVCNLTSGSSFPTFRGAGAGASSFLANVGLPASALRIATQAQQGSLPTTLTLASNIQTSSCPICAVFT